MIFRTQVKLL